MRVRPENLVSLAFAAFFAAVVYLARDWPLPAKLFPWAIGIPGFILSVVQARRDFTGWLENDPNRGKGVQMDETYEHTLPGAVEAMRTLAFFTWMVGIAAGIWLLGFGIAIPVFVLLYTKLQAREGWVFSLAMTAGAVAFTWGLFEYALGLRWMPGVLFR